MSPEEITGGAIVSAFQKQPARLHCPVSGNDTQDNRLADVVEVRHVGTGFAAGDDPLGNLATLRSIQLSAPVADMILGAGPGETSGSPLTDHSAFKLYVMRRLA
jgi:hypothetical protein